MEPLVKRQRAGEETPPTKRRHMEGDRTPRSLSQPISPPPRRKNRVCPSPWQLTWVPDLPEPQNRDAIKLGDILGDSLISECWEFNFLHDIDFLMNAFDPDTRHLVKVHVVHGFWKQEDPSRLDLMQEASRYPNVELHAAFMPEMFGTHHSKMMVLLRRDGTAQVVILTANMIPKDWTVMANAVWRSPWLPLSAQPMAGHLPCPDDHPVGSGERFKADLLSYLAAYDRRRVICKPLADELRKYDFSAVRAAFVASVPGRHESHDMYQPSWGWAALRRVLSAVPCEDGESEVVVQISSIATMGPTDQWLQKTLFDSLGRSFSFGKKPERPQFKVVFPTADEIRRCLGGYMTGASIHTKIQSRQQALQLRYLRPTLHHWANDSDHGKPLPGDTTTRRHGGRARVAPHIKTYIRYSQRGTIDWAMLTSSNMSKQAWGDTAAPGTGLFRIASWEVGVLVWPDLFVGDDEQQDVAMVPTFQCDNPLVIREEDREGKEGQYEGVAAMVQNIPVGSPARGGRNPLSTSFTSSSPLAEAYLASDIAACTDDGEDGIDQDADLEADRQLTPGHMAYRRPSSGVAYGGTRPVLGAQVADEAGPSPMERQQSRSAEISLLRDNHVLPPKHATSKKPDGLLRRLYRRVFSTRVLAEEITTAGARAPPGQPSEQSPLLAGGSGSGRANGGADGGAADGEDEEAAWIQAVADGRLRTTWQRETKTLAEYSAPLIGTFFLQYSINVASIFAVGRIGKNELGAVSVANMSVAISCIAPFQGLATSLDTLCAQAYGSGHRHLVGLQFQRMTFFLFTLMGPVAVLWLFAGDILGRLIPEPESVRLAALYLRVMIFAIPGIILFETGKRFTQAQGLFRATTYVLVIAAPLNIFLLWLLVWKLELGFVGAPISVAIMENLLPILLFLYVRFIDGSQCWGGFSKRAFSNWWVMIRLALPGMIMVEAEWLAFEIMTLLASRFSAEHLAAQSAVATLASISYQIPFPVSIAASTRIANLIGAGLVGPAKLAGKVAFIVFCIIGTFNLTVFSTMRYYLALLFTRDPDVVSIITRVLPIVAVMQVFDGLSAGAHGLLRGIGKQSIGGPANLIAYYVISLPISLWLAFGLGWELEGLWIGVTVGLVV
ncbi:multidrug resistance protein, MATE family [Geosmithia morbida]|uniref:Multidrug resistance protein, MATE family n=1 Tax=Geosmithia morbida TaxID=1094350 RepID=A0A9P5D536_9HYPO|nr:multidrug resistance protein, MATE family [Geosmithia morbida]KAF4126767.1 multidrug resistance protein, MATE family [Geosmithia morbida]